MYGKCENCSELNYLTKFEVGSFSKYVCWKCFSIFEKASNEVKQAFVQSEKRNALREAFGKLGEDL